MFHTSQSDRFLQVTASMKTLHVSLKCPIGLMGRIKLMNAKGTQTPIVKGEGLGE